MKNLAIFVVLISAVLFSACQQNKKAEGDKAPVDKFIDSTCYGATFENDTAHMVLKNFASGKVEGRLNINYEQSPKNVGTLTGKYRGDTLFVDYRFTSETKNIFTNPLAFLKKDGKLIMGVGQIETTLGRSYFVKDKPINFEVGKYIFEVQDCK